MSYALQLTTPLRVLRHAPGFGHAPGEWQAALHAAAELGAIEAMKLGGRASVYRAQLALPRRPTPLRVVVKLAPLAKPIDALRRAFFFTPARRAWRQARWMHAHRVPVAEPLALLMAHPPGERPAELLITAFIPGPSLLDAFAGLAPVPDDAAARIGRSIATLLRHGRMNRDLKPSNIMLPPGGPPTLIDTGSLAWSGPSSGPGSGRRAAASMLADLIIEPTGVGLPAPWPFAEAVARAILDATGQRTAQRAAALVDTARRVVQRHGDPTPRHNPLFGARSALPSAEGQR